MGTWTAPRVKEERATGTWTAPRVKEERATGTRTAPRVKEERATGTRTAPRVKVCLPPVLQVNHLFRPCLPRVKEERARGARPATLVKQEERAESCSFIVQFFPPFLQTCRVHFLRQALQFRQVLHLNRLCHPVHLLHWHPRLV